ncbi:MAG: melibiose carrier protein, partial [Cetobacterium sp.]
MSRIPLKTQIFYGVGVSYAIVDQIFAQWILY